MSPHLITLQDYDIGIRSDADLLASSPGFANIAKGVPIFGEDARQQARLHPRESFNQFWAQLSLDPLTVKNKYFRHSADLAHGHLRSLADSIALDRDTVIAVPAHYTRSQLSVLLGITRSCEIPVAGLVDLALLQAMASASQADHCIIIDLQLHQAILSSFRKINGAMQRERVVQVPATGLLALQDAWTNLIADEFIRQTRFDPKHNAEIEQYLYNQLDAWLAHSATNGDLLVDLDHKGSVHQARLTHEGFELRARNVYQRLTKELAQLQEEDSALFILASHLRLPGLLSQLPGLQAISEDRVQDSFLRNIEHIRRDPAQLQFISSLPLAASKQAPVTPPAEPPSHVLVGHKALALPLGKLVLGSNTTQPEARTLTFAAAGAGALILERLVQELRVSTEQLDGVLHNGRALQQGSVLVPGDTLQVGASILHLIQVE